MRPRIAITTSTGPESGSHGLPAITLNAQYVAAIQEPGGCAVLLTPAHDEQAVRELLACCHGLLLTGGEDVDPVRYGAAPHPELGAVNEARDAMEIAAVRTALERRLPILGICRGMQLLNVALGGTLVQDLASERPSPLAHEQEAPTDRGWHVARVREGSKLRRIVGAGEIFTNSFHHQAIDRIADALEPSAWAEDGVIEAAEGRSGGWLYAVQWHPERTVAPAGAAETPDHRLLGAFVTAARDFAGAAARRGTQRAARP